MIENQAQMEALLKIIAELIGSFAAIGMIVAILWDLVFNSPEDNKDNSKDDNSE